MGFSFLSRTPRKNGAAENINGPSRVRAAALAVAGLAVAGLLASGSPVEAQGYRGHYAGQRYAHPGYGRGGYRQRGFGIGAGVIGGLALGALAAGAYAQPYQDYGPRYVYRPAYDPYDDGCYTERRRAWNGYRYVIRLVQVCD